MTRFSESSACVGAWRVLRLATLTAFVVASNASLPRPLTAQGASGWTLSSDNPRAYEISGRGSASSDSGATLTLQSHGARAYGFGSVMTTIPVAGFAGQRVRVSADVSSKGTESSPAVWIRADSGGKRLILRNSMEVQAEMPARTMPGSTPKFEVALEVPANATHLAFGLMLTGAGSATAQRFRIVAIARGQTAAAAQIELDSAISYVKSNSLWRDTVTWEKVEPLVRTMAAGSQTATDVVPAIRELLARLGDRHSFLMPLQQANAFRSAPANNPRPAVRLQSEDIGYISVPAYGGGDRAAMESYVRDTHASLTDVLTRGVGTCRWVVDLRSNGGGNMWPMLAGLRAFLGDVGLGAFVDPGGAGAPWKANNAVDINPPANLAPLEFANVAVLTGPATASSGEAVAISFIGRANTRSFGLPTRGLSTANTTKWLPSGAMLALTTKADMDRNGKRYGQEVNPDEFIVEQGRGSPGDPQIERAVTWLKGQGCR